LKGKKVFTKQEVEEITGLIEQKLKADSSKQKGIRAKIRRLKFFASDFGLGGGYTVRDFLGAVTVVGGKPIQPEVVTNHVSPIPVSRPIVTKSFKHKNRDEDYVIDLCDKVLGKVAVRQHRFEWLKGDSGTRLPVDAYYPELNLVVEYMERQHTEAVPHFDKRMTVSGVSRGVQRKLYDQRRQELIPKHGINLVTISYSDFEHDSSKRLRRHREKDPIVIHEKLK
jgi:hypothetical protein